MTRDDQDPYGTLAAPLSDAEIEEALAHREPEPIGTLPAPSVLERPSPDWRDVVSPAAYEFIVTWETGGRPYYERIIKGRPIWPYYLLTLMVEERPVSTDFRPADSLLSSPDVPETLRKSRAVSGWWAQWWAHLVHAAAFERSRWRGGRSA